MKAGHKKTKRPFNAAVGVLADRLANYRLPHHPPDYASHEAAVTEAHALYNAAAQLHKINPEDANVNALHRRSIELMGQAMNAAYPPSFTEDCQKLRQGDSAGLETALRFLEADPIFFRTGYVKSWLIRRIKPSMLTAAHRARLQQVVLHMVDTRDDRDFRAFCRLACKVDGPELRTALAAREAALDPNIWRRARWVLAALGK
jgi:hypothetical protein